LEVFATLGLEVRTLWGRLDSHEMNPFSPLVKI
jgi:hypothetical protein